MCCSPWPAIGLATSLGIDRVPAAAPEKKFRLNFIGDLWQQITLMRRDQPLFLAVLGNTYFWFLGSLLFSTIIVFGPDVLHIGQTKTGYLNATLAVGIGIGSMIAGLLSGNKIEYGLIPLGSIGMTLTGLALGTMHMGLIGSAVLLGTPRLLGRLLRRSRQCAHPASARGREQGRHHRRGQSSILRRHRPLLGRLLRLHQVHPPQSARSHARRVAHHCGRHRLRPLSCCPSGSVASSSSSSPTPSTASACLAATTSPRRTGALLVCNHMSFVDVALLIASTDRPIRFLMYKGIYEQPHHQAVRAA